VKALIRSFFKPHKNIQLLVLQQHDYFCQIANSPVFSTTVMQNGTKVPAAVDFKITYQRVDIPDPRISGEKYHFACSFLQDGGQWSTR